MRILTAIISVFAAFLLVACGNGGETGRTVDEADLREFTLEELSQYDGRDGRDAYVAVDGYVYDVTNSSFWINGMHQGQVSAGQDLTDEIDDSPHGRSTLARVPRIGILVDDVDPTDEPDPTVTTDPTDEPDPTVTADPTETEDEMRVFTLDELSQYDGRDGRDAYVAVDGYVYDVTNSARWSSGTHQGFGAGQDLTDEIDNISPHGRSTLTRVPKIGILVDDEPDSTNDD